VNPEIHAIGTVVLTISVVLVFPARRFTSLRPGRPQDDDDGDRP